MGLQPGSRKPVVEYQRVDKPTTFRNPAWFRKKPLWIVLLLLLVSGLSAWHYFGRRSARSLLSEVHLPSTALVEDGSWNKRPSDRNNSSARMLSTEELYKRFVAFFNTSETAAFVKDYGKSCNDQQHLFAAVFDDFWAKIGFSSCINTAISNFVLDHQPEVRKRHRFAILHHNWHYAKLTDFFKDLGQSAGCPFFLDMDQIMKKKPGGKLDFVHHNVTVDFIKGAGVVINQTEDVFMQHDTSAWKSMRNVFSKLSKYDGIPVIFRKKSQITRALWQPLDGFMDVIFQFWQQLMKNTGKYTAVHIRRGDKVIGLEMKEIPFQKYVDTALSVCNESLVNGTCPHKVFVLCDDEASYNAFRNLANGTLHVVNLRNLVEEIRLPASEYFVTSPGVVIKKVSVQDRHFWTATTRQLIIEITLLSMADQIVCTMTSNLCRLAALIRGSYEDGVHSLDDPWHPM